MITTAARCVDVPEVICVSSASVVCVFVDWLTKGNFQELKNAQNNTMTDSIANLLTIIRNAYLARRDSVTLPHSIINARIADLLVTSGFLESSTSGSGDAPHRELHLTLRYFDGQPAVSGIKRLSRPSVRSYVSWNNIPRTPSDVGVVILSTSKGLMTQREAIKMRLGGELICTVW